MSRTSDPLIPAPATAVQANDLADPSQVNSSPSEHPLGADHDSWVAADAPMSEASEAYDVEILSEATVRRTLTVGGPTALYTTAMQTANFGGPVTRVCGQSGFPFLMICDSTFQKGGLNERTAFCFDGSGLASA